MAVLVEVSTEYADISTAIVGPLSGALALSLSVAAVPDQDLTQGYVPPLEGSSIRRECL
jgi:hypothetical protein